MRILIGDKQVGYHSATVKRMKRGYKIKMHPTDFKGSEKLIKKCIAEYNKGGMFFISKNGDKFRFSIEDYKFKNIAILETVD